MNFEWDKNKAASNLKKHGVTFSEAMTAILDPLSVCTPDRNHDERDLIIGQSDRGRVLVTVSIEKSHDLIRIISARPATAKEERRYEEGT